MTRLLKLATIIFTIISLTSAQIVDTLNTPIGPVTQGATVQVTWTLIAGVDATGKNGDLSAVDSATQNTIDINNAVPLAPKVFAWNVQVPPGTYTLGLNDGSGLKQSGQVVVKAGGTAPAPSGGGAAPAPAPAPPASSSPAGSAPAPAPPASSPPASSPPAGGASPSASAPTTTSGGAGAGGAAGAGAAGGSTTPTASSPASISTPSSSASSIFSGYEIVFSLLGVAIAMVQF